MNEKAKRLPDAELEVMQAIWECTPPVQRVDIDAILQKSHPMKQTTLLTLLTRLAEKKYIKIKKVTRSAQYIPLVSREDYLASQSKSFIEKLCGGSISAFANALCNSGLSKSDIDELKRLLDEDRL